MLEYGQSPGSDQPSLLPQPFTVIATREGDVLIKQTILKSDHFPGCQNTKLVPLLDGAPNFRQVDGMPVFGVAVPTVTGFRSVLDYIGATSGRKLVIWFNMREEPLLYINGHPYVVREADNPVQNLEYTGIDRSRVEAMEARLKNDVLTEAMHFDGQILVAHEADDFQILDQWESVTEADVQTPLEVYAELKGDGYQVDYVRLPITDEKAPKESDLDSLVSRVWEFPENAAIVFNCQMGRGRTTTGMAIATLLLLRRAVVYPPMPADVADGVPNWFHVPGTPSARQAKQLFGTDAHEDALEAGNYGVIRSLCRALDHGLDSKLALDIVLDHCAAMQNLRSAIAKYRTRIFAESTESKRSSLMEVCQAYLERYYMLIAFTSYLASPCFKPNTAGHETFAQWMGSRAELKSILARLLWGNPVAALQLDEVAEVQASANVVANLVSKDKDSSKLAELQDYINRRNGDVLGPNTILKEDFFPGVQSRNIEQKVPGAPNFRKVEGFPVYGVGIPTADGIERVVQHVMNESGPNHVIVWQNIREEPMVYINARAYVLREAVRPYKNMQEYAGINAERLEDMEQRLKVDVLNEAAQYGGRVLVLHEVNESQPDDHAGHLEECWLDVSQEGAVQTPREVALALKARGLPVEYYRVPVTDGTAPTANDIDAILQNNLRWGAQAVTVFNCQLGKGRTTVGMAVTCLMFAIMHSMSLQQLLDMHAQHGGEPQESADGVSPPGSDDELDEDTPESPRALGVRAHSLKVTLEQGGYLAVRKLVRLLDRGTEGKQYVDTIVDQCAALINLRSVIRRYRVPRQKFRFYRPELQARHAAFKRGSAYLERYCQLIALWAYLSVHNTPGVHPTFAQWLQQNPAVLQVFEDIHSAPNTALTALPPARLNSMSGIPPRLKPCSEVTTSEERVVLRSRNHAMLSRNTILKSYHAPDVFADAAKQLNLWGVSDLRQAETMPVYSTGNPGVQGMRNLLNHLGAGPLGHTHVVVFDLREELVLYVNGSPYLRRELEAPAAPFHHAGIHWQQLQQMEDQLKQDANDERSQWGDRLLLHKELPPEDTKYIIKRSKSALLLAKDVTTVVDLHPGAFVAPFWQEFDGNSQDTGLLTPKDVHRKLQKEGFALSYYRIPLSRERTPQPKDLYYLYDAVSTAAIEDYREPVYLVVSRSAAGSSVRFASAFTCLYLQHKQHALSPSQSGDGSSLLWRSNSPSMLRTISSPMRQSPHTLSRVLGTSPSSDRGMPTSSPATSLTPSDVAQELVDLRRASEYGEYRVIMNLCRVLPSGLECKRRVDHAISLCVDIGDIINDIWVCKQKVEQTSSSADAVAAARRLGIHYLQRYFLLLTFACYLVQGVPQDEDLHLPFHVWFRERKELQHMLNTLTLDT